MVELVEIRKDAVKDRLALADSEKELYRLQGQFKALNDVFLDFTREELEPVKAAAGFTPTKGFN